MPINQKIYRITTVQMFTNKNFVQMLRSKKLLIHRYMFLFFFFFFNEHAFGDQSKIQY